MNACNGDPWDIGPQFAEFERYLRIGNTEAFYNSTSSQRKLRDMCPSSDLAIVVTSPLSPFCIEYVNDAWLELCGFDSLEEVKGQTLSIIQGKETDTKVLKSLKKSVLTTGEFEAKDLINYTKAGKAFKNHLRLKPFRGDYGEILSFVGIMSVDEYLPDKRNVKFNNRIGVILIPARREYFDSGLNGKLWYHREEFPGFAKSAVKEIKEYQMTEKCEHLSLEEVMRLIY